MFCGFLGCQRAENYVGMTEAVTRDRTRYRMFLKALALMLIVMNWKRKGEEARLAVRPECTKFLGAVGEYTITRK